MKKRILSLLLLCPLAFSVGCSNNELGYFVKVMESAKWKQFSETSYSEIDFKIDLTETNPKVMTTKLPKEKRKETLKFETKTFLDSEQKTINMELRHNINLKQLEPSNLEAFGRHLERFSEEQIALEQYKFSKDILLKEMNEESINIWITKDSVTIPKYFVDRFVYPELRNALIDEGGAGLLEVGKLFDGNNKYMTYKITDKKTLEELDIVFNQSIKNKGYNNLREENINLFSILFKNVSADMKKDGNVYSINLSDSEIIKLGLESAYSALINYEEFAKEYKKIYPVEAIEDFEIDKVQREEYKKLIKGFLDTKIYEESTFLKSIKGTNFNLETVFDKNSVTTKTKTHFKLREIVNPFARRSEDSSQDKYFPEIKITTKTNSVINKNNSLKKELPQDRKVLTDIEFEKVRDDVNAKISDFQLRD